MDLNCNCLIRLVMFSVMNLENKRKVLIVLFGVRESFG